jgi:hypothetical protein
MRNSPATYLSHWKSETVHNLQHKFLCTENSFYNQITEKSFLLHKQDTKENTSTTSIWKYFNDTPRQYEMRGLHRGEDLGYSLLVLHSVVS